MYILKDKQRIVVTGIGPITPLGVDAASITKGILNQKAIGLKLIEKYVSNDLWERYYLHTVHNFDVGRFGVDAEKLQSISSWKDGEDNADLLFLLAAVKLALEDSGMEVGYDNNDIGLLVAHENPGIEQFFGKLFEKSFQLFQNRPGIKKKEFFNQLFNETVKVGYETQSFMFLFHIAKTFNIHRYSCFINNACASGLYAIELASDMIKIGKVSQMIVVAGDCPDIFKHLWFKMINMYEPDGNIKPFAENARGFVMGEGATAIILEEYRSARKRNAKIYAEYLGGGFNLESWGITSPKIGGDFYEQVIRGAMKNSKLNVRDINLICAHGVGTPSSDYYEAKAIENIFSNSNPPVTAIKPYIGHNLGGSTLMELAIILLCMQEDIVPKVLNTCELNPKFNLNLVKEQGRYSPETVLKICCAFAGYNAATIFRRVD